MKLLYTQYIDNPMLNYLLSIPKTYLFALMSGLSWALTTILAKQYLLKMVTPMELYILRMGIGFPLLALTIMILFSLNINGNFTKENYFQRIMNVITTKINKKLLVILLLSIIAGFFGIFMFWKVLEINNGSYSVAFVWPLVVLFTTLISYFFFNEKITTSQGIGIGLVVFGLIMLNIK